MTTAPTSGVDFETALAGKAAICDQALAIFVSHVRCGDRQLRLALYVDRRNLHRRQSSRPRMCRR